MCTFGLSGCRVKPRRLQPENSKRAHLSAPALQTPPKFHEKDQKRGKQFFFKKKTVKKTRNFGPPPFGPHRSGPHPSGPITSGPHFFWVWPLHTRGPHNSGPTLRGPTLRGPTLRGPTLRGPTLRAPPFGAPPFGAPPFGTPPFGAPPFGPHPSGPHPSGPHPLGPHHDTKTTMAKNGLAKIGLAKIGQIRMAKTGLAKVGPFRALGCSSSVPNFVEVLSLLYDPNQHRLLEGTLHLEGEMASVAFNLDTCMQPACINCGSDSAKQSKDNDNCKLSLHRAENHSTSESTTKAQLSCVRTSIFAPSGTSARVVLFPHGCPRIDRKLNLRIFLLLPYC